MHPVIQNPAGRRKSIESDHATMISIEADRDRFGPRALRIAK
jgi:hypothetical protein